MNTKHLLLIIPFLTLFCACSDDADDEKYASRPPVFEEIVCQPLNDGETVLRAGQPFVVTARQKSLGRLLNNSTYTWSDREGQLSHKFTQKVIYDQETQNPTDTVVAPSAGAYKLTMYARYNASGNTSWWSGKYGSTFQSTLTEGGKATYVTGGLFYFGVTLEKTIMVGN